MFLVFQETILFLACQKKAEGINLRLLSEMVLSHLLLCKTFLMEQRLNSSTLKFQTRIMNIVEGWKESYFGSIREFYEE